MKTSKNRSGFLSYSKSNNLGDYIQSIAAKELAGLNSVCLDREKLNIYSGPKINLIMNGWFMENSKNWPPSEQINPLFISFHINPTAKRNMLSDKGIEFFKKHEPIGCRDYYTQRILSEKGVKTYFSGCLTLTLQNNNTQKKEGILVLSALDRMNPKISTKNFFLNIFKYPKKNLVYKKSKKNLDEFISNQKHSKAIKESQIIDTTGKTQMEIFSLANKQLDLISKSKLVITSRIHTALPAISLGAKVIFLTDGYNHINQKSRLEGLSEYFYCCKTSDLKNLNLEEIYPKRDHKEASNSLIEKVDQFFSEDE